MLQMDLVPFNKIYGKTTNSYKFYWWLSIIEIYLQKEDKEIGFDEIVYAIISKMWFPVNYFKLSFGKIDQCSKYIFEIKNFYCLEDNLSEKELYTFLADIKGSKLLTNIATELTRYVPFRFIRPWFSSETRGLKDSQVNTKILELQNESCPYTIDLKARKIIINPSWEKWIKENNGLIRAHVLFSLLKYLEKENPNVPNLSKKLEKPRVRNLTSQTKYWRHFILENQNVADVFSKKPICTLKKLSIDHFLPWSFLTHDLIWNLHPIEQRLNSSKNNSIPHLEYFRPFALLQYRFCNFFLKKGQNSILESYFSLFKCSRDELKILSSNQFHEEMSRFYMPQFEIAANMGFEVGWTLSLQ